MKPILLAILVLFALQADNCGTAGSIQDAQHTSAKRAVDAEDLQPTPTPAPTYEPPPTFTPESEAQ